MATHHDLDTTPMWKRILAWQVKSKSRPRAPQIASMRLVQSSRQGDMLSPGVIAAQLAGVATQRELAKMMW